MKRVFYLLLFVFTFALLYYIFLNDPHISMEKFKADPLKYEGEIFQVTGKVGVVVDGKFYFDDKHLIIGSDVEAAKGGVTKLKLLVKDSKLYLLDYHNHDYLNFEIGLSVFALLIALVYFFREWKVTLRGFEYA